MNRPNTCRASRVGATTALAFALVACAGAPPSPPAAKVVGITTLAATVAGVTMPAALPPAATQSVHHGVTVADPYRFLENVKDPAVQRWMRAQADATSTILDKLPGRTALLERIKTLEAGAGGQVSWIRQTEGGRLFYLRRNPGENQFKLVWREGADGADTVVFDPETASTPGQPRAIMDFSPSRDGRRLAYSVQVGGSEIGTLHVIDVASGKEMIAPIDRIRYGGVNWLDDASGFFYARLVKDYDKLPSNTRFQDRTAHFRALDAAAIDRPVLSSSRNPELKLPDYVWPGVFAVPDRPQALSVVNMGVDPNFTILSAPLGAAVDGKASWTTVAIPADEVSQFTVDATHLYVRSGKGAPRYRILRMPLSDLAIARAQVVVPEGDGAIAQMATTADALYFTRREGINTALYRLAHGAATNAAPERVALPMQGEVAIRAHSHKRRGVVVGLSSWTSAVKVHRYDPDTRTLTPLALARDGAFDAPPDIESREVTVRSHDGTMVPVSIVSKKGLKLNGSNPTILFGYGAYGNTSNPSFNASTYAWLERGGVWVTAHVRGGGVLGNDWHQAGRKATKPNTWKDAIAVGEWLVSQGYTRSPRMAIYGGSAGGIFVGRAITERPDLFGAAVPAVGVMDTVRSELEANGPANIPEFGTATNADGFKSLLAMSSYHHVRDGVSYPAVMATHGVNDIRVDVWQSSKFAARMAAATTSGKPVLMRLEYDSGHGQGSTRLQSQQRTADVYSFMLWQFGVPEFQPVR